MVVSVACAAGFALWGRTAIIAARQGFAVGEVAPAFLTIVLVSAAITFSGFTAFKWVVRRRRR